MRVAGVNEKVYEKALEERELKALSIYASDRPAAYYATRVELTEDELLCVVDRDFKETYIRGPVSYLLGPEEHCKVVSLSAGVPKREDQLLVAKIRLGRPRCCCPSVAAPLSAKLSFVCQASIS